MARSSRFVLSAAAATLALFVWGGFSHMVLIDGVGFAALPDEPSFLDAADAIPPGLYAFPAPPAWRGEAMSDEGAAAFEASFRDGPAGLLIVRPRGEPPFSLTKLLTQLAANSISVLLALFVVSGIAGSRWRRAASITALGATGLFTVGIITWNWYAFTDGFFAALCLDVVGGWVIVGAILAALTPLQRQLTEPTAA